MTAICGFPPIASKQADTLILGSMPGEKSLQAAQYYAHPQNGFWKIMSDLFAAPADTYAERVDLIKTNKLALWDVLAECVRPGSLDSAIAPESIRINDFVAFLGTYKNITRIFFNGGTAEQLFKRHVLKNLPPDIQARLTLQRLPSTSPAMATLSLADKKKAWRAVKTGPKARISRVKDA